MKFIFYTHLPDEVKEDIKNYMASYDFADKKDDSEVIRLYCFYNPVYETYTNYTINPDELINEIDISYDETYIVELDLCDYYLDKLKYIVKCKSCIHNKTTLFNDIAKDLMAYGNEQVLNTNYLMYKYIDIFKLIIKLKEVI